MQQTHESLAFLIVPALPAFSSSAISISLALVHLFVLNFVASADELINWHFLPALSFRLLCCLPSSEATRFLKPPTNKLHRAKQFEWLVTIANYS